MQVLQQLLVRLKGKGEMFLPHGKCRRGAHLISLGCEPVGGSTAEVCDTWPVRCQTYGYLPSRRASLLTDWYQTVLLGDRGTCV